jgi:predicted nucleic acid-binding protein
VTVAESLVRPLRAESELATQIVEAFLRHFANLRVEPVTYDIAREAARIRAATALRAPDAMILATAVVAGATSIVSNDGRWASAVDGARLRLALCRLDEHLDRS